LKPARTSESGKSRQPLPSFPRERESTPARKRGKRVLDGDPHRIVVISLDLA
jgi:hypothetical protein